MNKLTIEFTIPFETEHTTGAPAFIFTRWLPVGEKNGIKVAEEKMKLLLWFDYKSCHRGFELDDTEIKKHVNLLVHHVNARIITSINDPQLTKYMQEKDFTRSPNKSEKILQQNYEDLGKKIIIFLLKYVNRLISYARNIKGQYWLLKYDYNDHQLLGYFQNFTAKGKIGDNQYFRFQPSATDHIIINLPSEERYISEDDWKFVAEYVNSPHRPPLVNELLVGAEQLLGNGYYRSALTEAVTALEVSIAEFSSSKKANSELSTIYGERLGASYLKQQTKHMGLNGTIKYLIPLIIPDSTLSTSTLVSCQKTVELRQNVVHNGQRKVDERTVSIGISNIRKCCKILADLSQDNNKSS